MSLSKALISRGYFPKELPPIFVTTPLGEAIDRGQIAVDESLPGWSAPMIYSLRRAGGIRRRISVPNPENHAKIAGAIDENWKTIIQPHLSNNEFGVTCPVISDGPRALKHEFDSTAQKLIRTQTRSIGQMLVRTDVQNFYPSTYTHVIPWALHGKQESKDRLAKRAKPKNCGELLDSLVRSAQMGQSISIPIGPDTSLIVAELIMISVEQELKSMVKNLHAYRYWDDFEIICANRSEADSSLVALEHALSKFELSLNPRKTNIVELPDMLEAPLFHELRRWEFSTQAKSQVTDISAFFDRLGGIRSKDPESSVTIYAMSMLGRTDWTEEGWHMLQLFLAPLIRTEPSILQSVSKLLATVTDRGLEVDRKILASAVNDVLSQSAALGRDYEVSWCLWIAIENGIKISRDTTKQLGKVTNPFGVLLALLAQDQGLLQGKPDTDQWRTALTGDELSGDRWLLAYEAMQQDWLRPSDRHDFRKDNPFFEQLVASDVTFLDLTLGTEPFELSEPFGVYYGL
jgi:hypothetical protein